MVNSILTNAGAAQALATLNASSAAVRSAETEVATGLKVSSPADDGATWSMAQSLRAEEASRQAVANSLARGQSITDAASAGAGQISDLLSQIKAKVLEFTGALSDTDKDAIKADVQSLTTEIDQVAGASGFNGETPLAPSSKTYDFTPPPASPSPSTTLNIPFGDQSGGGEALDKVQVMGAWQNIASSDVQFGSDGGDLTEDIHTDGNGSFISNIDYFGFSSTDTATIQVDSAPEAGLTPGTPYGVEITSATLTKIEPDFSVVGGPDGTPYTIKNVPMTSSSLGIANLDWDHPDDILTQIAASSTFVNAGAEYYGQQSQALAAQQAASNTTQDLLTTGVGNLVDADEASESAVLQASQLKQQLSVQALSIANSEPPSLLSLFNRS